MGPEKCTINVFCAVLIVYLKETHVSQNIAKKPINTSHLRHFVHCDFPFCILWSEMRATSWYQVGTPISSFLHGISVGETPRQKAVAGASASFFYCTVNWTVVVWVTRFGEDLKGTAVKVIVYVPAFVPSGKKASEAT